MQLSLLPNFPAENRPPAYLVYLPPAYVEALYLLNTKSKALPPDKFDGESRYNQVLQTVQADPKTYLRFWYADHHEDIALIEDNQESLVFTPVLATHLPSLGVKLSYDRQTRSSELDPKKLAVIMWTNQLPGFCTRVMHRWLDGADVPVGRLAFR